MNSADLLPARRIAGLDQHHAFEPIVIVGHLGVSMPRDRLTRIERVFAHENVSPFRDHADVAHLVRLSFPSLMPFLVEIDGE